MVRCFALLSTLAYLMLASSASAQEAIPKDVTADKVLASPTTPPPDGWQVSLSLGATGSFGHSSNVVGAIDGSTVQAGLVLNGGANYVFGPHSWENVLKITETQTRTPQLTKFLKSADELAVQSTYLRRLPGLDWLGPFARVGGTTQMFNSYDVRTTNAVTVRTYRDKSTETKAVASGYRIPLSDAFEPILLKETAGAFANPYTTPAASLKTKLGFGAQHVLVGNGFALADNKDTPQIELNQLEDSTQAGGEAEVELLGQLAENITWGTKAAVFYPVYTSVSTDLAGIDLMSTDVSGKLSVRLAKWASLDYVLSVKRIPLILDEWQVQNNVLLTTGFNLL